MKIIAILAGLLVAGGLLTVISRADSPQEQGMQDAGLRSQEGLSAPAVSSREIFYKMLLSVLLIIALGAGAIYVSKRIAPRISNLPNKKIRVIETAHLAPRKGLHLVQIGTRQLLLASTNETVTMLADVTGAQSDFANQLAAGSSDK